MWLAAAGLSAVFAGLTSILAKCGIKKTDSDVATAVRTVVVLAFSWLMVFVVGSQGTMAQLRPRSVLFLVLSGLATGASWICYFKALSLGDINRVVPIDKSSTVLSVLLAIVLLGERDHLAAKLVGTALLGVGIIMMAEKKPQGPQPAQDALQNEKGAETRRAGDTPADAQPGTAGNVKAKHPSYLLYAAGSAVFAALTSILGKVGISGVESNLGTAVRTGVVLVMAWAVVFARGKQAGLRTLDRRELCFLVASGITTGASWLCYYYAIQNGAVSAVVAIDKMSLLVTVAFSYLVFGEKLSRRAAVGLCLMTAGALVMALFA